MFIGGFLITLVVKRLNKFVSVKVRVDHTSFCLYICVFLLYTFAPADDTVHGYGLGLGWSVSEEYTHTHTHTHAQFVLLCMLRLQQMVNPFFSTPCCVCGSFPGCRIWFWIKDPTDDHTSQFNWGRDSIYIPTLLVGAGGSTLMVIGLTYISSLVGKYYVCSTIS